MAKTTRLNLLTFLLSLVCFSGSLFAGSFPFELSYSGRLTDAAGNPLSGQVDLDVNFYRDTNPASTPIPVGPFAYDPGVLQFRNVALTNGVFQLYIRMSAAKFHLLFPNTEERCWIQITDVSNDIVYPRQLFSAVPYAMKVPVDNSTVSFNANGELSVIGGAGTVGPQGPAGPAGPQGLQGLIGPAGPDGAVGPAGPQGLQGLVGPAGPVGPMGLQGIDGPAGPAGPVGPIGLQGVDGPAGPIGPAGAVGPAGPQGLQGLVGPVGPAGAIGPAGPQGLQGLIGPAGPAGEIGPAGPQGLQGLVGPAGPAGAIGPAGPAGAKGDIGNTGPTGAAGATGATGPQGPAGPAGIMNSSATVSVAASTASVVLNSINSSHIQDSSIANADISATAAIADTKLATIATPGKVSGAAITSGSVNLQSGQISTRTFNGAAATAIDWNNGNIQISSATTAAFSFTNLMDGGSYTLVATGATAVTRTFSSTGLTFRWVPAPAPSTANSHTVYTMIRAGTVVYVSWISGFQ